MTSQRRQNTAAHCKDEKTKAEHRHGQAPDPDQGFPEQLLRAAFALPRFCFSNKNLKKKNKESTPHDFMKTMLYHPGVSGPCRETGGCLSPSMHHRRQVQRRAGVCGQPGSTTAYTVGVRSCGPEPPPHIPGPVPRTGPLSPPRAGQYSDPGSQRPSPASTRNVAPGGHT